MLKALTIFSTIYSFHIEYFTDYTARETKLCLLDQLTAVVKNSNEDSSQTHKAQNGTILGRKSHKPFKNDHARLRISTTNQRSLHENGQIESSLVQSRFQFQFQSKFRDAVKTAYYVLRLR